MTPEQLRAATGCSVERAKQFAEPLSVACAFYGIDTPERLAAFLAQIGHESGSLRFTTELWGPTPAQARYEGRADLGNVQPGDGFRFRGRGLIQTTGRHNYTLVRDRLRARFKDVPDFVDDPEKLTDPQWAALSAADYWDDKGLNALADAGQFEKITRRINGGLNGQADRLARWERAKRALSNSSHSGALGSAQEAPVGNLLLPLASALIEVFSPLAREKIQKEMARHTDNPQVAEQIAAGVVEAAKQATGAADPIDAVVAVKGDAEALAKAESLSLESLDKLMPALEKLNQMEQANIAAARQYNDGEPYFLDFGWLKLKFIHLLSLVFVGFSGWFAMRYWPDLTPELKGAIITLMVIAGWNGVRDYWMGSSSGSDRKTSELLKK